MLERPRRLALLIAFWALTASAAAAPIRQRAVRLASTYQSVLIPLSFDRSPSVTGPFNFTDLWVHNRGTNAVSLFFLPACQTGIGCPSGEMPVGPGSTAEVPLARNPTQSGRAGFLIHTDNDDALAWSLRVRDSSNSSSASPLGTGAELPVARERDFSTSKLQLFPATIDERYTTALRIYDIENRPSASYLITAFVLETGTPVVARTVTTSGGFSRLRGLSVAPGSFETTDLRAFLGVSVQQTLRVQIETLDGGRFWSFIVSTRLDNGQFNVVSPQ